MKFVHPAGRLALGQTVVVLLGLIASFISMRVSMSEDWLPWSRAVRYGWPLLMAAPLVWMAVAVRKEADVEDNWSENTTLWTGLAMIVALVAVFALTVCVPSDGHVQPITESELNP